MQYFRVPMIQLQTLTEPSPTIKVLVKNVVNIVDLFCPADAVDEVKNCVNYVCVQNGGYGAIRELIKVFTPIKPI